MQRVNGRSNNPHHRAARLYDLNLALPLISTIRRQEAAAVCDLIGRYANGAGSALEVGPGTGFYTLTLARAFRRVVAVEESAAMARILRDRLAGAQVCSVTVLNHDFLTLPLDDTFDIAVAIGVLDYIADPAALVARLCAAVQRAVILSVPQRGFWGACFGAAAKLRGVAVYRHERCALKTWAPGWRCTVREVGFKTRFTRGLTLVAALEPPQGMDRAATP